jgi:GWxTD domain-containing protein
MKFRMIVAVIIAAGLFLAAGSFAADSLTLMADYATYYVPSDTTIYIELYYSLYRHQLGFIGSDDNDYRYAGVLVCADVFDRQGNKVDSASTYFLSRVTDESELARKDVRLFDYLPMKISPGDYRISLSAIDDVSKITGQTSLSVTVPDYRSIGFGLSAVEFAYEIRDVGIDSAGINPRLIKEGRLVVPNPAAAFMFGSDTLLYVYSELYGVDTSSADDSGFLVSYMIKDSAGNMVRDFGQARYDKPGPSAVLSTSLDIVDIPAGTYYLLVGARDISAGAETVASKRFTLYRPGQPAAEPDSADVQTMVDIAWFHLSEAEKIQVGKLSLQGKLNLIRQFWRDKDPNPMDPENPVYDEAVRRFAYANEYFSRTSLERNGWRTDRGRVYIMYGPYDEQDEVVLSGKSYPYIKWTYYELEGGCVFLFVNDFVAGAVDYRLVHSTHPRERYDPQWQLILDDEDKSEQDWLDLEDRF